MLGRGTSVTLWITISVTFFPSFVTIAQGILMVPRAALDIPRLGWVNLHFSILPAWRGAAPVQHAVWHGDDVTGATTAKTMTAVVEHRFNYRLQYLEYRLLNDSIHDIGNP